MPRNPVLNMDIATDWLFGSKSRRLQREYPTDWPSHWCAYMALLAEVWRSSDREVTIYQSAPANLPIPTDDAARALIRVGLLDRKGRIPDEIWADRIAPAMERIATRRRAASAGGTAASAKSAAGSTTESVTRSGPVRSEPIRGPSVRAPAHEGNGSEPHTPTDLYRQLTGMVPSEKVAGWLEDMHLIAGGEALKRAMSSTYENGRRGWMERTKAMLNGR